MLYFMRVLKGGMLERLTRFIVWSVLPIGLMVTLAVTVQIKPSADRLAERDFVAGCSEIQRILANRLDDHARILLSGAALFNASDTVTREEWRIFTQSLKVEKQLPGIQGLGFSLLIPRSELPQHIQQIRTEGFPEYQVRPEGEREVYSSIIYLEPFSGRNLRAFGYDMFSEPVRRVAMERARDTDAAALSGKVILVQETDQAVQSGTLMYVPVYRNGMPTETLEQRRAAIVGWVYSPYRMKDLLQGILGISEVEQTRHRFLAIFDDTSLSPQSLLFGQTPVEHDVRFKRQTPITFNGHLWTLCFAQTGGGLFAASYMAVWLILVGGTLSTLLLFALFSALLNTQADAQQLAKAMTADLQKSEESLRQVTERLSLAARAGGVGIWDYDVVNNLLVWDDQMFRLYGITREQFGGAYEAWQAGVHPEDRQRGDERIQLALRGEKEFDIEFRVLWPDGTIRYIRGFAMAQRDGSGKPLRMIGTNWDITEQRRAEVALRESEANFRTFFETMTDMIMVGTPEGRILFTNSAVTRTLGYTPDELQEMHLLDVHPADKRQEAESIFGAMFKGERESCPLPLVNKNGTLVPVETRVWFGKWNGENCLFGICKNLSAEQEAQQRFERLFRNNPSLIALSTLPDRRFVDVNDAFLTTLGYTREDIIGHTSAECGLFAFPEQHAAVADQLLVDTHLAGIELQVRCKDGTFLDGLFSGEVISNQGQQYFLTVMTDITARKHAEKELARLSVIQRDLMRLATEFVNVPLERQDAAIDQSLATMGQLLHADRAYLFAYDFDIGSMSNTHEWCNAGISPEIGNLQEVPNAMIPEWVETHWRGECIHIPSVAALPTDSYLWQVLAPQGIRSLITLPLMQGKDCLGFVGFDAVSEERNWREEEVALLHVLAELYAHFEARRATERETQALQKRLTLARDAAQEAALAKSLFLANMSHEIRTPLNAILGYAQIMGRECLAQSCPKAKYLSAITRSGEHLLELLTDLLELVRSDAHELKLSMSTFDFYQALEDVRLIFARHSATQALTLEVFCAPNVPQFICSDSGKVRQILVNLIGNALKFTEKGGVRLSVTVLPNGGSEDITLAVDIEDTGCGIAPEEQEHLFELFYTQAGKGRKTAKGTGLGLPLSRRYARAFGGDIDLLRSTPGEGSCFRFTFRTREVNGQAVEQQRQGVVSRLVSDQAACRIFVVDDDPANCEMLIDMLEPVGFTVETALSAALALHRLSQPAEFDLVLMDKRMPGMNGYEAIRLLRAIPGREKLAVIVVTASGFADEKGPALAAGADGYISKPVRREKLLEEIGRVTGVQYEYEPHTSEKDVENELPVLEAEALSCMPVELRRMISQALKRGDIHQLRDVVDTLALTHEGLANGIRVLVDAYDYARLRHLIEAVERNPQ